MPNPDLMNCRFPVCQFLPYGTAMIAASGLWLCGAVAQDPASLGAGPEVGAGRIPPAANQASGLIPAAFGIRTDREGNSWSIERDGNIGRIGNAMVNSGLVLTVNDEKFAGFQPMMSADGNEFVLQGVPFPSLPGLQAQRRVLLVERSGGLRYAELFYNGSTDPIQFSVGLMTHFSGNYQTFVSDRGRSEPVILNETESGIIVLPGASQSTRAFLFTMADAGSKVKPTISSQNRYGLTFRYQIKLDPGETAVIVHHVTQIIIPQNFDRATLAGLTRPHSFDALRRTFADDWKDQVVNYSAESVETAKDILRKGSVETLGVTAGATDTLAIGEQTRLYGKTEGGPIRLKGRYGEIEIELEKVAALTGQAGGTSREGKIFLRDGQIFTGEIIAPELSFVQTGGARLAIDPATLDRLVMASAPAEKDWTTDSLALVETYGGDRLKVRDLAAFSLNLTTPWGILPISLDSLAWLRPGEGGRPGYRVELKNGTIANGLPGAEALQLGVTDLGPVALKGTELKSIFTPLSLQQKQIAGSAPIETVTRVAGGQALVGPIVDVALAIVSGGSGLETAVAEIRRIRRVEATTGESAVTTTDAPAFEIERWDGGRITGYLSLDFLSIEVQGRLWLIPIREVQELESASPLLTPESLQQIEALISQLGADDWAKREEATRNLGAFGYLVRPVLQRELGTTKDPEVGRRIERVLAGLN